MASPEQDGSNGGGITPIEVIHFDAVSDLIDYESSVIRPALNPDPTDTNNRFWESRVPLTEQLHAKNFWGKCLNITLIPLTGPYDALVAHKGALQTLDGKRANRKAFSDLSPDVDTETEDASPLKTNEPNILGYALSGEAHSSGRGVIGSLDSLLVYAGVPAKVSYSMSHIHYPSGMRRVVAKPEITMLEEGQTYEKHLFRIIAEAEAREARALKNRFSSGMPGRGKRR